MPELATAGLRSYLSWRSGRWWLVGAVLVYPLLVACGMRPALPFDLVLNLGGLERDPALAAPDDGTRRLVVLQHGLWRTEHSLDRLARALREHGYDVLNPGYPSTSCSLQQAAAMLHAAIEAELAGESRPVELFFATHSMGGLVVQEYQRRQDAREFAAGVHIAVPHRGAILCDLRKHWWPFPLLLGDQAAMQLSPGDPVHEQPLVHPERCGAVVGDVGAGNDAIPGHDDGTVGVDEARLPGAADTVVLPLSHTRIASTAVTARQVVHFLKHRRFAEE